MTFHRFPVLRTVATLCSAVLLSACQHLPMLSANESPAADESTPIVHTAVAEITAPAIPELSCDRPIESADFRPAVAPYDTVWQRIRDGFSLDHAETNKRVAAEIRWYARHPEYIARVTKRSGHYIHYIVEELEKENLPLELALLPIVESAFDPFAYSHGRASGMWQFIASTAKIYGVKQDWWYDGRRDVIASTDAAISYLKALHSHFGGNWMHALAAYNSGEGRVDRAIRKNRQLGRNTEFWDLQLPRETRGYVPKLLAISKIVADPERYGVNLTEVPDTAYFEAIELPGQIDLAMAAEMAQVDIDEIYRLNPGFNRWATSPDGPHRLLVPVDQSPLFSEKLAQLDAGDTVSWQRYTIKNGDVLGKIAQRYKTDVSTLQRVNDIKGHSIRAGKTLLIPVASKGAGHYSLSSDQRLAKVQNNSRGKQGRSKTHYKVRSGDSFWNIARRYGVTVRQLAKWNGMAPKDVLRPGRDLVIWTEDPVTVASLDSSRKSITRKVGYRVRKGDSLARIADKFDIKISDITRWNSLDKRKYLQPGQSLTLYVNVVGG